MVVTQEESIWYGSLFQAVSLPVLLFFNSFLHFSFSSNDVVHWTCSDQGGRSENIAEAANRKAGGKEEP